MRNHLIFTATLFVVIFVSSCKKDKNDSIDCFTNTSTVRHITNKQATINLAGGQFYIVESGSIDTKLNPCNLAQEYQVDKLQVTISGEVKSTMQSGAGPCCTENFFITKITK